MENFTPFASLIGGSLIGLSASVMLFFNGKIAGISGIVAGLLSLTKHDTLWRVVFLAGPLPGGVLLPFFSPPALPIWDLGARGAPSLSRPPGGLPSRPWDRAA